MHEVRTNNLVEVVTTVPEEQRYSYGRNWIVLKSGHWKRVFRVLKFRSPRGHGTQNGSLVAGWHQHQTGQKTRSARLQVFTAVQVRSGLLWNGTQLVLLFTDVSRYPTGPIFWGKVVQGATRIFIGLLDPWRWDRQLVPKRLKLQMNTASHSKRVKFIISFLILLRVFSCLLPPWSSSLWQLAAGWLCLGGAGFYPVWYWLSRLPQPQTIPAHYPTKATLLLTDPFQFIIHCLSVSRHVQSGA